MSSRQFLKDASTRHQVFLERYAGGESKQAIATLNRLRRDIAGRLAQEPTDFARSRLNAVLRDIEQLSSEAFSTINKQVTLSAKRLVVDESAMNVALYNKGTVGVNFAAPSEAALLNAVAITPMTVQAAAGVTIATALDGFSTAKSAEILNTITDSVVLGDTSRQVAGKVSTLIGTRQIRQVSALVRTVINNVSSIARSEVMKENLDIAPNYQWVATLDNRTTLICGSRDGVIYRANEGNPLPPAHWNCRSTTIPIIDPKYDVGKKFTGERPSKGATGATPISANKTYGGWLKDQPKEFVDEALGVERSRLFRSGKLTLDKFVDPTGRVYTLEQLRGMNPIVFQETAAVVSKSVVAKSVSAGVMSLNAGVAADGAAAYNAVLNTATATHIAVMQKYPQPNAITTKGNAGSYRATTAELVANPANEGVLLHEYGHHIDFAIAGSKFVPISMADQAFEKAFLDDRKKLGLRTVKTKFVAMQKLHDEMYDVEEQILRSGRTIQRGVASSEANKFISDIVDAMTGGLFQAEHGAFGHGKTYYKRRGSKNKETFANMFYLRGTDSWGRVKELFPNTAKRFDEIIKESLE